MEELKGERDSADEGNAEVHEIDGDGRGGPEEGMRSQEVDSGEEERTEEEHSKGDEGRADEDASSKTEELFEGHEINHDDTSERDSEPDPTTDNQRNASTCPPIPAGGPPRFYPAPRGLSRARACACTPVAPFILLSMQRSGSGWFETLLNSHPHVRSHGELFSRDTWRGARERARLDDVYNLGRVTEERECLQAVGFKWMLNQVRKGALRMEQELGRFGSVWSRDCFQILWRSFSRFKCGASSWKEIIEMGRALGMTLDPAAVSGK